MNEMLMITPFIRVFENNKEELVNDILSKNAKFKFKDKFSNEHKIILSFDIEDIIISIIYDKWSEIFCMNIYTDIGVLRFSDGAFSKRNIEILEPLLNKYFGENWK